MKYWSPHTLLIDGIAKGIFSGILSLISFSAAAIFLRSFTSGGLGGEFDSIPALITIGTIGLFSARG